MELDRGDVAAYWPCWTCLLLRSTRSITASYCAVSVYHTVSAERRSAGSARILERSTAVCLAWWSVVNARVHQVRGAAGLRPRTAAVCAVHRRSCAADRRTSSAFPHVCGRYAGLRLMSTDWCQPAPSQHVTVLRRRVEVDVQQQAAAECSEDGVNLGRPCTPSSSHSWSRRPSRIRLCPSGLVRCVPWCVRRWCYDDEGTHQPRAVVVLWYTETAQVD